METRSVEINICQTCNWACPSCNRFCDILHDSAVDTIMSIDEVRGILAELKAELSLETLTIIGGEPTMHPDCIAICRLVCEQMAGCSKRIQVATNNSRPDVVAQLGEIPGLAIRVDDRGGASAKRSKHCNMYDVSCISRDRSVDFRKCPEYRQCGIGVFKHRGKIRWYHCPNAQFLARVLDIEDGVSASSLHDLLTGDWSAKYSHLLCQYCYRHPAYRRVMPHNFGVVSDEFAPGYAKIVAEAKQSDKRANEVARMSSSKVNTSIWDRFDMVIVLAYTGYLDRIPPLRAELERVGLAGRVELFWSFPSPFDTRFASSVRLHDTIAKPAHFNEAMSHYRAMKTALELGKENVLILEDDVRFMCDLGSLASAMRQLPDDYDLAKLEWFTRIDLPAIVPSGVWTPIPRGSGAAGGAAIAYTHRALEWKTAMMEAPARFDDFHSMLYINDQYDTGNHCANAGLHAYVATPMLAIQEPAYSRSSAYRVNKHDGVLAGESTAAYGGAV